MIIAKAGDLIFTRDNYAKRVLAIAEASWIWIWIVSRQGPRTGASHQRSFRTAILYIQLYSP